MSGSVWFLKMVDKLVKFVGHVLEGITQGKLMGGELGDGVLKPIGIGSRTYGFGHGNNQREHQIVRALECTGLRGAKTSVTKGKKEEKGNNFFHSCPSLLQMISIYSGIVLT